MLQAHMSGLCVVGMPTNYIYARALSKCGILSKRHSIESKQANVVISQDSRQL